MKKEKVISEDVALNDLELFVNQFVKRPDPREDLKKKHLDILEAIQDGFLVFDADMNPTLTLKNPIKNDKGEVSISEIKFVTRILPSKLTELAKGLHPVDDLFLLQNKMTGFIISQPVAMLDKFSRYDLDVINQLAAIFS